MKDIPVFTTDFGVASLILKEIPYRGEAYIRIQDLQPGMIGPMIDECVSFCVMAGAETVYATGSEELEGYPFDVTMIRMTGPAGQDGEIAMLWPVLPENVAQWREIYNRRMKQVPHAATMISRDEQRICDAMGTYFVHDNGRVLGIGWLQGDELLAVASEVPGEGERVTRTLLSTASSDRVSLEVASTNTRAISLYNRMGFIAVEEISRWYRVR